MTVKSSNEVGIAPVPPGKTEPRRVDRIREEMAAQTDCTVRIYPLVEIAGDAVVEDFVILGKPCGDAAADGSPTCIESGAVIRSHAVIYAGVRIGKRFACGHHVMIRELTRIGSDVSIGTGSVIEHRVVIEDRVRLHSNVFVPEFSTLHRGCWLGPNVVLTNAKYPQSPSVKQHLLGPTIMPGATIGANVTILPGIKVGADSLIGAGSVVTRDVPDRAVVVGNPARVTKTVDELSYT